MKKLVLVVIVVVVLLLSACAGNKVFSNREYSHIGKYYDKERGEEYIYSVSEGKSSEEALFKCKKLVIETYYPEVLSGDSDHDWMAIMTSLSNVELVNDFEIRNTDTYCVSINVYRSKNEHLFKEGTP